MEKPSEDDDEVPDGPHHHEGDGHGEDGHHRRPDEPTDTKGDTPEARLEDLVDAVLALKAPKLHEIRGIIETGERQKLPPGAMAYLKQVIFDNTGVAISVLNQVHTDCRNTDPSGGVLYSADLLADSALARLQELYTAIEWTEGYLWHYAADTGAGISETGYFDRSDPQDIDRFLLQEYGTLPSLATKGKRTEVSRRVTALLYNPTFFDDAPNGLNVRNGFIYFDPTAGEVKLLPADPQHKARSRLMVDYDPGAMAPVLMAGLARTFPDAESIEAFREFVGCALLGTTPGHDDARHGMLIVGPRKGGKSTLLELLRLLVPSYAIAAVPPTAWGRQYDRAMLSGKKLNIVSELGGNKVVSGSDAKAILSHEVIDARLPYQDPFSFRPKAWHIFACNSVPRTDDPDPSFERRFLGLLLERSLHPDEVDPGFLAKVTVELAGVVAWLVEGAVQAMTRGHFVCPSGHHYIMAEMQHGDDTYARFAIRMVDKAPDTDPGVSTKAINAALARFAQREGRSIDDWKPTTGARRIASLLRTLYGATQYQLAGVPHYRGIRLKPGD